MKIKTFLKIALKSLTPLIYLVTFIAALLLLLSFKNSLVFSEDARIYVSRDDMACGFSPVDLTRILLNEEDRKIALDFIDKMKFFRPAYIPDSVPIILGGFQSYDFKVFDRGIEYNISSYPAANDGDPRTIWTVHTSYIPDWHEGNLPENRIGGGNVNRNKKRGVFTLDEDTARKAIDFIKNVEGTLVHQYTRD